MIEQSGIIDEISTMNVACYTTKEDIAAHMHDADIGISRAEFGVAEFGGVCQDAFSIESRLVSTLPPIHIVFLNRAHIVPGIEDALEIISKVFQKGYVSWITGPSRTADIERVLTIGVHGPSRLVIIAVSKETDGGAA
jgi:L-lactate dehydrogenase complex protein LldG